MLISNTFISNTLISNTFMPTTDQIFQTDRSRGALRHRFAICIIAFASLLAPTQAMAQASGSIGADPNPCLIPDGDNHCNPLILWDSSGVTDPKVAVTVSASWGTQTFHCSDANQAGSKQTVGINIGVIAKTFRLYAVPDCTVDPQTAGTLLAEEEVSAYPPGSVVCPVDNKLLSTQEPGYLGLIGNATVAGTPDLPFIAAELADAGIRNWRRTVQWFQLERNPPANGIHTYDWPRFDNLFLPMVAEGIAPWITLSHTAPWAADFPGGGGSLGDAFKYPPQDIQDWRDFVRAVAERYGPGGILSTPVRHWDIWQEPDLPTFFLGTPADYVELLNAAFDEIKQVDPSATVWAGNVVFVPGRPASATDPWIDTIFAGGLFDGFAIHPFFQDVADYYQSIADFRARLTAQLGPSVPLAVTATSYQLTDDCAFAALTPTERAAYVFEIYACGANAGASHVMWFKTIDREPKEGTCPFDANGMFTPKEETPGWLINKNLEGLRRIGEVLDPHEP